MSGRNAQHRAAAIAALPRRGYWFAAFTAAIWAGFVPVSRLAGKGTLTSFDVIALRFGVAGLLLAPFLYRNGLGSLRDPVRLMACVATGGVGYALFAYSGFYFAPAAHGSILLSGIMPFFTALLSWVVLGERPDARKRLALLLIGLGVACMLAEALRQGFSGNAWIGDLLFITGSMIWCLFTVLVRRWQIQPWDAAGGVAVASALLYLPIYALCLPSHLAAASWQDIALQGVYQGVLVVIVAMVLYTRAIADLGPTGVTAIMATVPAISALISVPLVGEPLRGIVPLGIALVSLGALTGALRQLPSWRHGPALLRRFAFGKIP